MIPTDTTKANLETAAINAYQAWCTAEGYTAGTPTHVRFIEVERPEHRATEGSERLAIELHDANGLLCRCAVSLPDDTVRVVQIHTDVTP